MKCYYIIKLPGGGEVKLLATVPTIVNEGDTKQTYESLYKQVELHYKNKPKTINSKTPLYKAVYEIGTTLTYSDIVSLIKESSSENFMENLNKAIERAGRNSSFETTLRKQVWKSDTQIPYINTKGKESTITLVEFLHKIQVPIHKKYFSGVSSENLIGVKTLHMLKSDLEIDSEELTKVGLADPAINSLRNILNAAFFSENRADKIFFEIEFNSDINDAVVVKPENSESPLIFYNGFNDLSLFIGLLKYMGTKILEEDLLPILEKYNEEVAETKRISLENFNLSNFFIGNFELSEDTSKFNDPAFNIVLANSEKALNAIVELIILKHRDGERGQKDLKKDFKNLFRHFDSKRFGKALNTQDELRKEFSDQEKRNRDLSSQTKGRELQEYITEENIDYYYSRPIKKENFESVSDLYYYLNSNVTKNQDLVKVVLPDLKNPKNSRELLIVPTEFKMTSKGIKVTGFYDNNGNIQLEKRTFIFVKQENPESPRVTGNVSYRKLLSKDTTIHKNDAESIPTNDRITIIAQKGDYLPSDLVYSLGVRGSTATIEKEDGSTKSMIIKGVYPGVIKTNSFKNRAKERIDEGTLNTSRVKELVTHKSLFIDAFTESDKTQENLLLSTHVPVQIDSDSNFFPVNVNDYIKSKYKNKEGKDIIVYNKVVGTDDDVLYILIKTEKHHLVKAISKKSVLAVYKQPVPFPIETFESIAEFHNTIKSGGSISGFNFSSAENYEAAKEGDYLVYSDNSIYKLINKERREGIRLALSDSKKVITQYSKLPDSDDVTVVTNRRIDTPDGYHTALLNSIALFTEEGDAKSNEEYREVRYFIPKEYKANQMSLLPSGNLVGGILEKNSAKKIPDGYVDATEDLIKLINEDRNKKGDKLLMKVKNEYYVRYNMSLYNSDFSKGIYNEFLTDTVSYIEFLSPKFPSKSEGKIYKVLGISDENGKKILSLEYSRFNDKGNLVTQHRKVDFEAEKGQIKWLYTMKGSNETYKSIIDLDNDIKIKDKAISKQLDKEALIAQRKETLNSIASKFQKIFKINVSIESHSEKGLAKKKAWIETSPEGKPKIILNLNNQNASSIDLVHEYLHLFLMALKYNTDEKSDNMYEMFLSLYVKSVKERVTEDEKEIIRNNLIINSSDLSQIEEFFIEDITNNINEERVEEVTSYDAFRTMLETSLDALNITGINFGDKNLFALLNFKMSDIFGKDKEIPLNKSGLILFESNFRDWLSKQINEEKITIEC